MTGPIDQDRQTVIMDAICHAAHQCFSAIAESASLEMIRPSVLYRPELYPDGTKWCALYGKDLMEGVAGFGDTPAEAMADFDKRWNDDLTPTATRQATAIAEEEKAAEISDNGQFGVGA